MKATKKIVGASCALVAAVALSAGSTFAWFASNNKVTATGMHVQATVPTNLYIEKGYIANVDSVNKDVITIGTSAADLSPAAVSTEAVTGATISAANASGVTKLFVEQAKTYTDGNKPTATTPGTVATYTDIGTITPDMTAGTVKSVWAGETADGGDAYEQIDYIYSADMTLANKSKEADIDAKVTIGVDAAITSVSQTVSFLRVGFLIGSTTDGTTWTYDYVSAENDITIASNVITTGTKYVYDATKKTVTIEFAELIKGFKSNSVRTVTLLAWFDGNDSDCFVNNAASVNEFNLSVEYEAKAVATPTPVEP